MIRIKQWASLTAPQKRSCVELASALHLPLADLGAAVFHVRGDWVTSVAFVWRKLYLGRVVDDKRCEFIVLVVAQNLTEALGIFRKTYGGCFCTRPEVRELCIVAGENESKVISEERL